MPWPWAAMGAIFSVSDNNCRRPVAMKVLDTHLDDKLEAVLRFIEEAQIAANLSTKTSSKCRNWPSLLRTRFTTP